MIMLYHTIIINIILLIIVSIQTTRAIVGATEQNQIHFGSRHFRENEFAEHRQFQLHGDQEGIPIITQSGTNYEQPHGVVRRWSAKKKKSGKEERW